MTESRKSPRVRTMLGGRIVFNKRNSTLDCKLRNISEFGAKVILDGAIALPEQFELEVPQKGKTYVARMIWRHEDEIGVAFVNELMGQHAVPVSGDRDGMERLRELEIENEKLRRRVADLQNQLDRYAQTI